MEKNNSLKIIITGGNGMVGKQAPFDIRLSHKQLDILSSSSIEKAITKYKPTTIIHLAAMTDMLECEKQPKLATRINVQGTKNIAKACKKHGIKLVYLSTCAVFDGKKKTPYLETDKPNPINVYGKTKLQGEQEILKLLPNALIIRTGWLFGGGKNIDSKFVGRTLKTMRHAKSISAETVTSKTKSVKKLIIKATQDRSGSPTYVRDLLSVMEKLISKNVTGISHVINAGQASYYDIARRIKQNGGFHAIIIPVNERDIVIAKLKRGKMEALGTKKNKLRRWEKAIADYIGHK